MTAMGKPDSTANISAAGLLLTTWCNARCAHCYVLSHPGRRRWMDEDEAGGHLASLASLGVPASGVHLGGGEPFGNYPRLLSIVRTARDVGLAGIGYVETNGYWATSDAITATRLTELREAGMQQISISADVFHQSWIDPACVRRLHRVADDVLGPNSVRARRWRFLQSPADLRQADEATRRDLYRKALRTHGERMTGRAARVLASLVPRQPASAFARTTCRDPLVAGGHVHIDPKGHVFPGTCAGLLLGRATKALPLEKMLLQPPGPVRRTLIAGGPVALMRLAEVEGYTERDGGYADKCHLCTDIRTFLVTRHRYAGEVGPREMIGENESQQGRQSGEPPEKTLPCQSRLDAFENIEQPVELRRRQDVGNATLRMHETDMAASLTGLLMGRNKCPEGVTANVAGAAEIAHHAARGRADPFVERLADPGHRRDIGDAAETDDCCLTQNLSGDIHCRHPLAFPKPSARFRLTMVTSRPLSA